MVAEVLAFEECPVVEWHLPIAATDVPTRNRVRVDAAQIEHRTDEDQMWWRALPWGWVGSPKCRLAPAVGGVVPVPVGGRSRWSRVD